jgi:hypothetical protein
MLTRLNGSLVCVCALALGCGPRVAGDGSTTSAESNGSESDSTSTTNADTDTAEECPEPIVIDGTLKIEDESEIPDYDCVVEITGNLEFEAVPMTNLDGFPRLERVGGMLVILWTDSLVEITGFPALREVGSLWIEGHDALESIEGYAKLEHVMDDLVLDELPVLTNIEGLAAVTSVGSELSVWDVDALESLEALQVESIGGMLTIRDCDVLSDLSGLDNLTVLPHVLIWDNDGLVSLAGLEQVTQMESLELERNAALTTVDALVNLHVITDRLNIEGNPELASLAGLAALSEVGGNFELVDNDALPEVGGPEFPMAVTGQIHICGNGSLVWLPMMLTPTGADVTVLHNHTLPASIALEFVTALGHPDAKVGANDDLGDYPLDPCPYIGDGICDESERTSGDIWVICELETGDECCHLLGPTGLCPYESEGDPDCPLPTGPGAG